jgi:TRAP-type C4-dicarboxylate transport system substrate-binding protein
VSTVDALRKTKMFVWAGDDKMVSLWKELGFNPVPLAATDIMTGLQTGMLESYPTTPLLGLTLQWYRQTPNMVGMGMAPLVGGLVMTKTAWAKIGHEDQERIRKSCEKLEHKLEIEVPRQDTTAIAEMQKRGLRVNPVVGPAAAAFRATAEQFATGMKGIRVPAEVLDMARRERDAFRARNGGSH